MLNVYLSPAHLLSSFLLSFPALHQHQRLSLLQQDLILLQFPLPDMGITTDIMLSHWAIYFQGSGLPLSVAEPGQIVYIRFI